MKQLDHLHHAFFELVHAIVKDGKLWSERDKEKLRSILMDELRAEKEIIDLVLRKEGMELRIAYLWASQVLQQNHFLLDLSLQSSYMKILEEVTNAFSPLSTDTFTVIQDFRNHLKKGLDPDSPIPEPVCKTKDTL